MSSQPVGRGVAMREARRADLREERAIAELADDSLRADSARARLVDAQTVLDGVAEVGPNYQVRKAEGQRARRARLADAVLAAAGWGVAATEATPAPSPGDVAPRARGVRESALAEALADADDGLVFGDGPLLVPHSADLSRQLVQVRRRLREFLEERKGAGKGVPMEVNPAGGVYPTMRFAIAFGTWLATTRKHPSRASAWHFQHSGDARAVAAVAREGRGSNTVEVMLDHMKNHVWRELWPALPVDDRAYWRVVKNHVMKLFDGGGMKAAADVAGAHAASVSAAGGGTIEAQNAARSAARKATEATLRAATTPIITREHLYQTGEYQVQDVFLSEPFSVNAAFVVNAFVGLARVSGARPGMAVNDGRDGADPDGFWFDLPPLCVGSLNICDADDGVQVDGGVATMKAEVSFKRTKGGYFAAYDFGTTLAPDSDETMRLCTVGLVRLLVRTASFRACYAMLGATAADALRAKVGGTSFAGLELVDTAYASWEALVAAVRADGYVADASALERPLFPGVDDTTGRFLFNESAHVSWLRKQICFAGRSLGMDPHKFGLWSFRKDACEQPAQVGDGEVAARVLGHRHVDSRTMDRVYRADLRTRDLAAYWTGRDAMESIAAAPLTSLSARRVPEFGGVRHFDDVPEGPERTAAMNDEDEAKATAAVVAARSALESALGRALSNSYREEARAGGADAVAALSALDAAGRQKRRARARARDAAVRTCQVRIYKDGLERLRTSLALRKAMATTHSWRACDETAAIAFGLDRADRTRERVALCMLPLRLRGSIVRAGALHVLPNSRRWVYESVRTKCAALCTLRDANGATLEWPVSVDAFVELGDVQLCWRCDEAAAEDGLPRVTGAAHALGASTIESYDVWRNLGARATIGNPAFDVGTIATEFEEGGASDERVAKSARVDVGASAGAAASGLTRAETVRGVEEYSEPPVLAACFV